MDSNHRVGRWLRHLGMEVVDRHLEAMSRFAAPELAAILSLDLVRSLNGHDSYAAARLVHDRARPTLGAVPALLALDAQTFMTDDVLVKVDRTSMLNSLEVRAPLLDHRVVEYVARLPFRLKMRGRVTKLALRECVRSLLPPAIVGRGKQGFGLPLERWFGLGLEQLGKEILLDSRCRGRGWLDPRSVTRLLAGDGVRRGRRAHQIFALCCLELWAQTWVDRPREALGDPLGGCQGLHASIAARTIAE